MMISVLKTMLFMATMNYAVSGLNFSRRVPENDLRDDLLRNYNPKVFPAPKNNQRLTISIFVSLSSLEPVDIRSSTVKIVVFFFLKWKNHQLAWNGTQFDSVKSFQDLTSSIWVPKIVQYGDATSFFVKNERELTVFRDGHCELPAVETLSGICESNIKEFPSDVHNCSFSFYLSNVDTTKGNISLSFYNNIDIINGTWSVQGSDTTKKIKGNTMSYSLNLVIKRSPNYIQRKVVTPLIILVVFTVTSHVLPIESGERIGLSMTSLLTMMISLQYAMEELPETDIEPIVLYYGRLLLFCMIASLLLTIAAINLYHREGSPMPRRLKAVLPIICRVFFVAYKKQGQVSDVVADDGNKENEKGEWITLANILDRFSLVSLLLVAFAFVVRISPWLA